MITKNFSNQGDTCEVTFRIPGQIEADTISVLGDFNGWNPEATPFERTAEGDDLHATVTFQVGVPYRFRYFADGCWLNDATADIELPNRFGGLDGVIDLTQAPVGGNGIEVEVEAIEAPKTVEVKKAAPQAKARKTATKTRTRKAAPTAAPKAKARKAAAPKGKKVADAGTVKTETKKATAKTRTAAARKAKTATTKTSRTARKTSSKTTTTK